MNTQKETVTDAGNPPRNSQTVGNCPIRSTRFERLGYAKIGNTLWRFVDLTDTPACVGPYYKTKTELLCDAHRYATQVFGA